MKSIHNPKTLSTQNIFRHYLEDIIYGANYGIITTFTIISGVEGASLSPMVVIILGFVNLFADGISMGASRYLSIRAGAAVHNQNRGILEPMSHAMCTFLSFLVFGFLPLISFLILKIDKYRFEVSIMVTILALFFVGSMRVFISKKHWFIGGIEMLLIGGSVSFIAYGVGFFIRGLL